MSARDACRRVYLFAFTAGIAMLFVAVPFTSARWFRASLFCGFAGVCWIGVAIGAFWVRQLLDYQDAAGEQVERHRVEASQQQLAELVDATTPSLWRR